MFGCVLPQAASAAGTVVVVVRDGKGKEISLDISRLYHSQSDSDLESFKE